MRAYSEDLRSRVVAAVEEEGLAKAKVARRFKIDRATVYRYLARAGQGNLKAKTSPGRTRKLSPEQMQALQKQLETHSDNTLMEHAERFAEEHGVELAFSTVNLYCRRLGITRKKRASMLKSETRTPASNG
jgi:putative transposase